MRSEMVSFFASAIGLVLSVWGVFLPWGRAEWIPWVLHSLQEYLFGIELLLGAFALIGSMVSSVFLLLYARRKRRSSAVLILAGSLIVMLCSLAWILNTDIALRWSLEHGIFMYHFAGRYIALYGAYITLIGSVLTSSMRVFNFFMPLDMRNSRK